MTDTSERSLRHLHREIQRLQRDNSDLVSKITQLQNIAAAQNTVVSPVNASPSSSLSSLPPLTPSPPPSPKNPTAPPMANINANVQAILDFAGDETPPGPTKWFQTLRIALGPGIKDAEALFFFELKLVPGKPAETWFQSLPASDKDTLAHLKTAFLARWPHITTSPAQVASLRDRLERDVLTEEEALSEENGVYGYVRWVRCIRQIARELEDPQNHLLASVINKLPHAVYRNVPPSSQSSWDLFEAAVSDLPLRAVESSFLESRAQGALLEWAKQQNSPASIPPPPRTRYTPYRPPAPSQLTTPLPAPTINVAPPTPSPQTPLRPPFQNQFFPQTPSTGATGFWQGAGRGRGAGNLFPRLPATPLSPSPSRSPQQPSPISLTPGSAPLGSRECWACGQQGHTRCDCTSTTPLPAEEQLLRQQAGQAALDRARQIHQLNTFLGEYAYPDASTWMSGNE